MWVNESGLEEPSKTNWQPGKRRYPIEEHNNVQSKSLKLRSCALIVQPLLQKLRIIRRPGERYCADCIQERGRPDEKDLVRIHAWGIIGWNYKKLFLYETENKNRKMCQKIYIQLLSTVEQDLRHGGFILEEDNDSRHKKAIITK